VARERYRIGDLTLDVDAVSLRREGPAGPSEVPLPKLSFDLLVALARRAPSVIPTEELIARVWPGVAISDETLTQRVALLRRALGEDAKEPRYLRSVRGRGYQLIPEAVPLGEDRESGAPAGPSMARGEEREAAALSDPGASAGGGRLLPDAARSRQHPRARRLALGLAATALVAAGSLALVRHPWSPGPAAPPKAGEAPPPAAPLSTRAATVPELLDRAGAYLRQQQEGDNELAIELYRRVLEAEPRNPRALAGLSFALSQRATKFNRRDDESAEALDLARRAVALDPGLGLAHHALGLALDARGYVRSSLAAYRRAAELDPEPGPALASAAHLLQVSGHLAEALEADLRVARGPRGDDSSPYLDVQIGSVLALLGFDTPAAVWFERALELRPDNVFAASAYARLHLSRGRLREADALAEAALARGVRRAELWEIRGTVALLEGRRAEARRWYEQALQTAPGFLRARTRLLLLQPIEGRREIGGPDRAARRRDLIADIHEGRRQGDEWPDSWIDEALLAAAGDVPAALTALDGAIEQGYRDAGWLALEPGFAALRDDPAFRRRMETIRRKVDAERQRVLGAPWLPSGFLAGAGGRAASR